MFCGLTERVRGKRRAVKSKHTWHNITFEVSNPRTAFIAEHPPNVACMLSGDTVHLSRPVPVKAEQPWNVPSRDPTFAGLGGGRVGERRRRLSDKVSKANEFYNTTKRGSVLTTS